MSFVVQNPALRGSAPVGTKGFLNAQTVVNDLGLHPGMRAADFGCGLGFFTMLIARQVGKEGKVTAVDVQEAVLDSIHTKAKENGLMNVDTVHADLEVPGSSRLADGSQDMVLMANVLFQSQKKTEILTEAKRVLVSSGRLVLLEWDKGTGGFGPPDELRMDRDAMKQLVQEKGFAFERMLETGQYHYGLVFTKL